MKALGVGSNVRFCGALPNSDTLKHIHEADVMVFPSLREFGGAVVFERTVFKSAGGSGKSQLYLLDLTQSGATPTLFLQDQSIEISDRPDWLW